MGEQRWSQALLVIAFLNSQGFKLFICSWIVSLTLDAMWPSHNQSKMFVFTCLFFSTIMHQALYQNRAAMLFYCLHRDVGKGHQPSRTKTAWLLSSNTTTRTRDYPNNLGLDKWILILRSNSTPPKLTTTTILEQYTHPHLRQHCVSSDWFCRSPHPAAKCLINLDLKLNCSSINNLFATEVEHDMRILSSTRSVRWRSYIHVFLKPCTVNIFNHQIKHQQKI